MNKVRQQSPPNASLSPDGWNRHCQVAAVCLVLAAMTFAVFGQTAGFGFVNFDDDLYVYDNTRVTGGLSWKGLVWVFTHVECSLYHPLTMLSLMADSQIYGRHPGGYHLTNVLLHTISVLLLFLILCQMTGAFWRSAFVAAVFAIHPLRAESVAWVAERKDVLSGFFFMLTLAAYIGYARKPESLVRYLVVAAAFVLALLTKPTMVTLPFVLLLLDFWPLRRAASAGRLVLEKLPLLALATGTCAMTVLAAGKWISLNNHATMPSRIGNALVSYFIYLRQMVWPVGLAVPYPFAQHGPSSSELALATLLLVGLTAIAWGTRRTRPWLLVGWLWYLGMLAPMIGIVQVGSFSHSDRFTYLAQIGIYIAATWLLAELGLSRMTFGGLMAGTLVVLMACAWRQTSYWKDSETLWTRTLSCTTDNELAHYNFGIALFKLGRTDDAIIQFQDALHINPNAVEPQTGLAIALLQKGKLDDAIYHFMYALHIDPDYAEAHNGLGSALLRKGKVAEATAHFQKTLQVNPDFAEAHYNLANMLLEKGSTDEAIKQFAYALQLDPNLTEAHSGLGSALLHKGRMDEAEIQFKSALQLNPNLAPANYNLGNILLQKGKMADAINYYQRAIQTDPDYTLAHVNLGNALLQEGKPDEAIPHYGRALQIDSNSAPAHINLGGIFLQKGNAAEAIAHFQRALQIQPKNLEIQNSLAWLFATSAKASLRNGDKAVQLAQKADELSGEKNPVILRTLAAAFAEAGRFDDARRSAQQAVELAKAAGRKDLANQLNSELKLYEAGRPFHQ